MPGGVNAHWFLTLADAREKLEAWRRDYNEVRPRGVIGNRTLISLHISSDAPSPLPRNHAGNSTIRRSNLREQINP